MESIIPPKIEVGPAQMERLRLEDLTLVDYKQEPGGHLGLITRAIISHPQYGERTLCFAVPMSKEAVLQWVALTINPRLFAKGDLDASFSNTPQEKPQGVWEGDPLEGMTHEEKQVVIQQIRDRASGERAAGERP